MNKTRIVLDTESAVSKFVAAVTPVDGAVYLTDGDHFRVNAKSLLGVLYVSSEWKKIYVESDAEIYHLIRDFMKDA